jgi:5,10-methylenetetrahydromethanopterin reductase
MTLAIGPVLGSSMAPEQLIEAAARAEQLGFQELWLSEDYFFTGGISGAAGVLAATEQLKVGLGVVSAITRHPALLAMELATLARQYPGRLRPGIGLGVPAWLRQMGVMPPSPLEAMEECLTAIRQLLAGERLTREGALFTFRDVALAYPLETTLPLAMGVSGPKMLQLSGRVADASILSVTSGTAYVRWARERIDEGRADAERTEPHRVTVFALFCVDEDGQQARAAVRSSLAFYRSAGGANALTDVYGISDELRALLAEGGADHLERKMPDRWVEDLTVAGTPEECAEKLRGLHAAGADSVGLFPVPSADAQRILTLAGERVLPLLRP